MSPLLGAWAAAATPTPGQTPGPFYPITRPLDADADLTVIQGRTGHAHGRVVHLTGRVLDARGAPVRGAKVELWQANARGRYAHPFDGNPAPLDPNFQGFGVQTTDAEGQYRFKTIKPGAYAVRTPHIHFDIAGAGTRLVTQMYFPGEPANGSDFLFGRLSVAEKEAATASPAPAAPDMEPDALLLRWDIVLATG